MKNFAVFCFALLCFAACQSNSSTHNKTDNAPQNGLSLLTEAKPEWQYEQLRLYPIVIALTEQNCAQLAALKTLSEGMQTPGFRITELKQFGRSLEPAVNALTVQNKSKDMIYLMSGDVVRGGNQDRVIAQDQIAMPGTVHNMDVFCVEHGRWQYDEAGATDNEKALCAFKSYYNMASPEVRKAVQRTKNQQEVWDAVSRVTALNSASSNTGTYAALEQDNDIKVKREAYISHLSKAFMDMDNVVGIIAVRGDEILSADVFGHPTLFARQFPSLLHGIVAESAANPSTSTNKNDAVASETFRALAALAGKGMEGTEQIGKFAHGDCWVHLYKK